MSESPNTPILAREQPDIRDQTINGERSETFTASIVTQLPSTTNLDHSSMPTDLSCLEGGVSNTHGLYNARTRLFGSHWFEGIKVHGADVMFETILEKDENIYEIESIKFLQAMSHQLNLLVYQGHDNHQDSKPAIIGKVKTNKGRSFQISAFQTTETITEKKASNTFVDDICAYPLAQSNLRVGEDIRLNALPHELQVAYDQMSTQNPIAMASTTIMDIMITTATALVIKNRIGSERQTGGGFENLKFFHPEEITSGAILTIDDIPEEPPTETKTIQGVSTIITTYPLKMTLKSASGQTIATGTFKLKDLRAAA